MLPQYTPAVFDRFWSKVDFDGPIPKHCPKLGPCWIWAASLNVRNGYGQFHLRGRTLKPHRIAFEMVVGPIPSGLHCLHHCDNPRCLRPDHLHLGTDADNANDRLAHGRTLRGAESISATHRECMSRGQDHWRTSLTDDQVHAIRLRYESGGITMQKLADQYGVGLTTISNLINRRTWAHI